MVWFASWKLIHSTTPRIFRSGSGSSGRGNRFASNSERFAELQEYPFFSFRQWQALPSGAVCALTRGLDKMNPADGNAGFFGFVSVFYQSSIYQCLVLKNHTRMANDLVFWSRLLSLLVVLVQRISGNCHIFSLLFHFGLNVNGNDWNMYIYIYTRMNGNDRNLNGNVWNLPGNSTGICFMVCAPTNKLCNLPLKNNFSQLFG